MTRLLALLAAVLCLQVHAGAPAGAQKYRAMLTREAQFIYGPDAPVPLLAGQIHQESGWRADVTAWDNGRGLAQFMDATATQIARTYPELGAPNPYDPRWAVRALVRYDDWLRQRVRADDDCNRWMAALKGYNAGLGYVQRAQRRSDKPGLWLGATEWINAGQSAKNFEYSRLYPRWIAFKHQRLYADWGRTTCP